MKSYLLFACLMAAIVAAGAHAQPPEDIGQLKLRDWQPRSMLKTKATLVEKPKFPVIDVHNHLGGGKDRLTPARVQGYLQQMDAAGVRTVVNLDGGWDQRLQETLAALDQAHPSRFLTFALLDFQGIDDPDWSQRETQRLERGFQAGAKGLKLHKSLGLSYRYRDGRLMPVDDPKLDPIWEMCARYHRPVVIHVGDPAAFFTPLDRFNRRWHELNEHLDWLFCGEQYPERDELLAQRNRAIARHPRTTFICASGQQSRGPRHGRAMVGHLPQHVRGHRREDLRVGTAAVHREEVLPEIPGPHHVRHGHRPIRMPTACTTGSWKPTTSTSTVPGDITAKVSG